MKEKSLPQRPRRNRAVLTCLSVALLTIAPSAWSLDLLESYQAAKQQDASILASRAATDAGRERLPQARSQFFPSLSANAGRTKNRLDNTTQNLLGVEQTTQTEYPSSNESLTLR
jgi:outer membrane protein, protease secretion system